MQFWALIVDSFRESRDRNIFWVMLGISVLVAAAMFCVSFEQNSIRMFFGLWNLDLSELFPDLVFTRETLISLAVYGVMDHILGNVGVLLALIATASFFPSFMDRGAIDIVLSKPISRPMLFLGKYLGSVVFVVVQATVFVVLTFLVVGLRWGVWMPGYLLVIPLMALLFSYYYCISVWVGVRTRSTVASVLLGVGAWAAFSGVHLVGDWFEADARLREDRVAYNAVRTACWVLPRSQDITYLACRWSGAHAPADFIQQFSSGLKFSEDQRENVERAAAVDRELFEGDILPSIGASLAFEAVIVLSAMWYFTRKDF